MSDMLAFLEQHTGVKLASSMGERYPEYRLQHKLGRRNCKSATSLLKSKSTTLESKVEDFELIHNEL